MKNSNKHTSFDAFKRIFFGSCLVAVSTGVAAQSSLYSNAAEALQQNTHNTYINGNHYTHSPDSGFDFWWNANGLDALTEGYIRTRSDVYRQRMKNLLHGIRDTHGGYINHFYDDMEWLGLASVKAYKATGDSEYLDVANVLWQDILTGRSTQYYGAISWNKGCHPSCKNAISNSPAALLGAQLHRITGNAQQLQIAQEVHAYVKNILVTPTGGVYDAWDASTNTVNTNPDWVFSYNVGTYLAASVELWEITGNQTYLNDAVQAAEHAFNQRMVNGVFYTNESGQGDGGLFKGIFIRSLAKLAREGNLPLATRNRYLDAIEYNAQILIQKGIRSDGLVGPVWNARPSTSTELHYSTQLSGIMLLEAAASADQVVAQQHLNYAGYGARFSAGNYSAAQMVARGARDNDITSIVVPPDTLVTLFDGDNFTGASRTQTNNAGWIGGDWNDRVTSMRVISRDITDLGGTVTAEYPNSSSESEDKIVDNNPGSKYLGVNGAGGWVQYQTSQAYTVNSYAITAANDAPERDPMDWTLYASNDGSSWTALDVRSGEDFANRFQKRRFDIANSTAYRYYRLDMVQNSSILFQLSELELFANDVGTAPPPTFNQKVQAESYSAMSGVQLETGAGAEGQNVGWIDANDWMAYSGITIPTSGNYTVTYRVASPNGGGRLSLDLNGGATVLGAVDIPSTGGWFNWTTVSHTVYINAGTYSVGVFAVAPGWNIDWWSVSQTN